MFFFNRCNCCNNRRVDCRPCCHREDSCDKCGCHRHDDCGCEHKCCCMQKPACPCDRDRDDKFECRCECMWRRNGDCGGCGCGRNAD